MKKKTVERDLEAIDARVTRSREQLAALTAGLNELAEWRRDNLSVDGSGWHEVPGNGGPARGAWAAFRHRLDQTGAGGGRLVRGLAVEIERHPLLGGLAAFGIGFGLAMVIFRRRSNGSAG